MNKEIKFNRKEIDLLIALVVGQKGTVDLMRGLRKPNKEEQAKNAFYNSLIKKIKILL